MSFELIVRPFIEPAIRPPARPPVLPFQDTPEQGVAVLRGLGGKLIDLTFSETSSWSKSRAVEVSRVVDEERIYQKEKDAAGKVTINKENYVDVERVKKLTTQEANGEWRELQLAEPPPEGRDNIEVIREDVYIPNPRPGTPPDEVIDANPSRRRR